MLKIREITKIVASTKKTGLMIIPIQLYEASNRRLKLQF
ncbi:SsrA-binding protein [Patescibacteria group bacterium]|nr:SsrA-binding protein [Patescibacteria group bacterium]